MTESRWRVLSPLSLVLLCSLLRPGESTAAPPDPCAAARPAADEDRMGEWLKAECYKRPALAFARDREDKRPTGPAPATAPHGRVTVYYSPEVHEWLRRGRPAAGLPDGALIVKEMFNWKTGAYSGHAAMLKERRGSFAGWFFYPGGWLASGCIGCHASAKSELNFADLSHITGQAGPPRGGGRPSALVAASHPAVTVGPAPASEVLLPSPRGLHLRQDPAFSALFPRPAGASQSVLPLPSWEEARAVVPGPAGPAHFLPSTNCFACHDAQVADPTSNMVQPGERKGLLINVSPYGEWSASLMGLSGRDPVFHAQLESEKALRPALAGYLDDTCYSCHGVAGQRQIHEDLKRPFEHSLIYAKGGHPLDKYGALARDGVTCTACHHIAAAGLGQEETFTGRFALSRPDELYGPYRDEVRAEPMKQALGITPTFADHLRSGALCGSCHTVILPRVPAAYRGDPGADAALGREHEQTTYLEWRNSIYSDEAPGTGRKEARTCQACHMPQRYDAPKGPVELATKIATIEEYLPNILSSQPAREITLSERRPYSRHTLVGLNVFVMQMFAQFHGVLGIPSQDPEAGAPSGQSFVKNLTVARREAVGLAQRATARVELVSPPGRKGNTLFATVRVTNLSGHKFPTGVGFRRAFLEFQVLDRAGQPLWSSGRTSALGVILQGDGAPLPSEFTFDPQKLQRHYQQITRPEQVQIYEERSVDERGRLTTSFLGLFQRVKDNRLLPRGWSPGAPGTAFMQPVGQPGQTIYPEGRCWDEVTYAVPLEGALLGAAAVQATLYYQSIPPYYLADRFAQAGGPEVQRLYFLASGLDVSGALKDWKLMIASTGAVPIAGR